MWLDSGDKHLSSQLFWSQSKAYHAAGPLKHTEKVRVEFIELKT